MSLPRLISIAAPHYGEKNGGSLVKLAQIMERMALKIDWRTMLRKAVNV